MTEVAEVLEELKIKRLHASTKPAANPGSNRIFVVRNNEFVDVSDYPLEDTGLTIEKQQAFIAKIDSILLGKSPAASATKLIVQQQK